MTLTSKTMLVTPGIARKWLGHNRINRTVRPDRVLRYCAAMRHGKWTLSNDDICFDPDGNLLNGQHRLEALVLADTSVMMTIKEGVPLEAMVNMDRGAGRTFGDQLAFLGEKNHNLLAASLKLIIMLERGISSSQRAGIAIPDDELVTYLHQHPSIRHSVEKGHSVSTGTGRVMCSASPLAVTHWLITEANSIALADYYLDQLRSRANEPPGSAVLAVDNRLRSVAQQKQKYQARNFVFLLVKGWNVYAANKVATKLEMMPRGEFVLPRIAKWARPMPNPQQ